MKSLRFVCGFVVFAFGTLLMVLAAQLNPVVNANHPNALPDAQQLPAGTGAQLFPASQGPPVHFAKPVLSSSGGFLADSVAIADLNGDGHLDLVVANVGMTGFGQEGVVSVLLGNGDGTFQAPVGYDSGGIGAQFVVIADVNGDGYPDLVVANSCESSADCNYLGDTGLGGVGVLLGNGDGTFQAPVRYSSGGGNAYAVAVADLNGDGYPDLVVANWCESSSVCSLGTGLEGGVSVLLGNGDGTFQAPVSYDSGGFNAASVAVADLNGDGHPDVVVANAGSGWVSVLLGNGDGTLQAAVDYSSGAALPWAVAIADFNSDGKPDLAVGGGRAVSVLLGNGDGTFQAPVSYDTGGVSYSVAIGDLNGDAKLDVVAVGSGAGVLVGNGDGTFQPYHLRQPGGDSVAIGDANGDGKLDLVVARSCERTGKNCTNGAVGVALNNLTASTTTAVTSSLNPSQVSQTVTFTATISSNPPIPNQEVVTFYNGATNIGTGTTTNGVATLTTSFPQAKTYTIKATYAGDAFHKASSGTVKQVVNP
jgi:hypothetical protein